MNYKDFFKTTDFEKVSSVYIDTPYTGEQYSRFYHILETVSKYDNPQLEYKAKYRTDRFTSNFSLKSEVKKEFKEIWQNLIQKLEGLPQTLVLLDYHADNLMITPAGDCGILDFQDACIPRTDARTGWRTHLGGSVVYAELGPNDGLSADV